jgi:RNA polymerase sigma-70 factor (ECF subfamily)
MTTKLEISPLDDATLVERIRRGDENAFTELYLRYARYVAGVAYRLAGNEADLDDVVQETFIAAARGIHGLRDPVQVRVWLVTIAVRCARGRLSAAWRRRALGREVVVAAPRSGDLRDRAPVDDLYETLGRLPERMRVPWMLSRVEGLTLAEVAEVCGISLATVKRRIAEAEKRIERCIDAN